MKRIVLTLVVAVVASITIADSANAQSRGRTGAPSMRRSSKPVTSPYLNLLNNGNGNGNGNGVGFNYFQRVKPEQEFRAADQQLGQGLNAVQKQVNSQQQMLLRQSNASNLTQSGHATSFFSLGNYYPGSPQGR